MNYGYSFLNCQMGTIHPHPHPIRFIDVLDHSREFSTENSLGKKGSTDPLGTIGSHGLALSHPGVWNAGRLSIGVLKPPDGRCHDAVPSGLGGSHGRGGTLHNYVRQQPPLPLPPGVRNRSRSVRRPAPRCGRVSRPPPFAVSIGIWYVINVIFLFTGIHLIASMLEVGEPPGQRSSRRWWSLRIVPLLICLPCVGSSLNQGQVTPLLFAMIAAGIAAIGRGRDVSAGMWLAAAASVKIYPIFLVSGLIVRKNGRALAGVALGLFLGLVVLPVLAYGSQQTLRSYQELESVLIGPAFGWGNDSSRMEELLSTKGPRSQSIVNMITNAMYPDRMTRPTKAPAIARLLHWGIGGAMMIVTFWSFRRSVQMTSTQCRFHGTLLMSSLTLVMILICPVTHLHYLMLALPATLTLLAIDRGTNVYPSFQLMLYSSFTLLRSLSLSCPVSNCSKNSRCPVTVSAFSGPIRV